MLTFTTNLNFLPTVSAADSITVTLVFVFSLALHASMSAPWDDASFPWDERPLHGTDAPTVVEAVVSLKSWEVIAEKGKETLHLRGFILLYWTDPRLVGFPTKAKGEHPPETIWRPGFITCAGFGLGPAEQYEQVPRFYAGGLDKQGVSDGQLEFEVPMSFGAEGFDISGDIDRFRSFPFDSTRVDVSVLLFKRTRPEWADKQVALSLRRPQMQLLDYAPHSEYQQFDLDGLDRHSNDYQLSGVSLATETHAPPPFLRNNGWEEGDLLCGLLLSLHIRRSHSFYVVNSIKPMYTIAAFGFCAYAIEPSHLADRVGLCAVLFLSIYAVQWTTAGHIPRLPFKTVLDDVSESVSAVLMLILIGNVVAYHRARPPRGCARRLEDVDEASDEACAFDDEKADAVDLACSLLVLAYVLLFSLGYRTVYAAWVANRRTGASRPWTKGPYLRNKRFRPTSEAYHLRVDDAFAARHGKKYLGQGERVANAAERW